MTEQLETIALGQTDDWEDPDKIFHEDEPNYQRQLVPTQYAKGRFEYNWEA